MKITFSARHFDATEKLQNFAKKEVDGLGKYADNIKHSEIILEQNDNLKSADIRLNAFGSSFISKVEGDDFYKVIPKCVEKIRKQLKAKKSKVLSRA